MTDSRPAAPPRRPGWGARILKWVLIRIPLYYLAAVVGVTLQQRRMIYQPPGISPQESAAIAQRSGLEPWKNSAGEQIGWRTAAATPTNAAVLVLHGNASLAEFGDHFSTPIRAAASADVYLLEYPGYGVRAGSANLTNLLAAGDEAVALLTNYPSLYVVSESLGTGVAAHVAKHHPQRVSGLMLFTPYNNFLAVARRHLRFFPVDLMLRDRFAPDEWLADYRGPVGFRLATADEVIPLELGQKLFDGYRGPKKLWLSEGAGHNDVAAQSAEWWKSVFEFWRANQTVK